MSTALDWRECEALLATLSAINVGVLLLDANQVITASNEAFSTLLEVGLPAARLAGVRCPCGPATFDHAVADPPSARQRCQVLRQGVRRVLDDRQPLTDGTEIAHTYDPVTVGGITMGHLWIVRRATPAPPPIDHPMEGQPAEGQHAVDRHAVDQRVPVWPAPSRTRCALPPPRSQPSPR